MTDNIQKYEEIVNGKRYASAECGIDIDPMTLNPNMKDFQRVLTWLCLKRGRAAMFEDTGLGKTIQFLSWARAVCDHAGGMVLIASPLGVTRQTVREASRWGIQGACYARNMGEITGDVVITNYEMLKEFDESKFSGVCLDEGQILKNETGATRNMLIEKFSNIPFRLICTATPAPNDHMELGNHAEFLGIMRMSEMLSTFFVHDGGETSKWRLKGHGVEKFWEWLATWAVIVKRPSDLGFDDEGYDLPPLNYIEHVIDSETKPDDDKLFSMPAKGLVETRREKRESIEIRCAKTAEIVNASTEQWAVWCDLNDESKLLSKLIPDSVEVTGSMSVDDKMNGIDAFANGTARVIITKAKIAGFGSNWQHAHNMADASINHSWESFYQRIRRMWRYGQIKPVNVNMVLTNNEVMVLRSLKEKEKSNEEMGIAMVKYMAEITKKEIESSQHAIVEYTEQEKSGDGFTLYQGDCVKVMADKIPDESVDYSIFSPPFSSLYTYSASEYDMGNTRNNEEFINQFRFCVDELFRVLKPGRLVSFHCMNLPSSKQHDGFIGIRDFRGELIKMFVDAGFIYHSEVVIWKDPVTAMQRTKALGLLWKQIKKDSAMCRQGIPDYLVTMRKPGANQSPIAHTPDEFPVGLWQRYASPVWFDIDQSDTLNRAEARENEDERHICPLQLGVIRRALKLWTNPGDTVFTPFLGIGSEVYTALKEGRSGIGIELKPKYFDVAFRNCVNAKAQLSLFDEGEKNEPR